MAAICFIILSTLLFHPVFLLAFPWEDCPMTSCGKHGQIRYPFTNTTNPGECGPFVVGGCDQGIQKVQLRTEPEKWYDIQSVSRTQSSFITEISLTDKDLQQNLYSKNCESLYNLIPPIGPYTHPFIVDIASNFIAFYKCSRSVDSAGLGSNFRSYKDCPDFNLYYNTSNVNASSLPNLTPRPPCSIFHLPVRTNYSLDDDIFGILTANFSFRLRLEPNCHYNSSGLDCAPRFPPPQSHTGSNTVAGPPPKEHKGWRSKLGIGIGCSAVLLIILVVLFFVWHRYYRKVASSKFLSANTSSRLFSKSDLERSNLYFGVSIFVYAELEEATNNFASENELGDGGFGTVYYGKLPDGREVAVKRLYERNYRKVQQFLNEIEILTRLRHKNLVSIYGCTSRHSRELLLVYEYIPNGTVADHLHGDQAISSPLTWPIRMRIAIETASALVYLHASDVIHRDVKTNNILLDNNFCVKVADFGISRLFPGDVTHISTAPQGTPGYVDPEYYQCYQLTDKSDVYSFGVVLVELISSMPAVDITRHRHEINLANLALNKIQKCEFDELIDSNLGYQSDEEVKRMTTCVAELAFLCLQHDKEMRPSMAEVLEELKRIERRENESSESQEEEFNDA